MNSYNLFFINPEPHKLRDLDGIRDPADAGQHLHRLAPPHLVRGLLLEFCRTMTKLNRLQQAICTYVCIYVSSITQLSR